MDDVENKKVIQQIKQEFSLESQMIIFRDTMQKPTTVAFWRSLNS